MTPNPPTAVDVVERAEAVLRDARTVAYADTSPIWLCGREPPFTIGHLRALLALARQATEPAADFNPFTHKLSETELDGVERVMTGAPAPMLDEAVVERVAVALEREFPECIDEGRMRFLQRLSRAAIAALQANSGGVGELVEALAWIEQFATIRAADDSKTFARVNRGAMRTIAEKASAALAATVSDTGR